MSDKTAEYKTAMINETLNFIERYDPTWLNHLRERNADERELLKTGQTLGDETDSELLLKLTVTDKGLSTIKAESLKLKDRLRARLRRSERLQTATQVAIAVGGASLFVSLAKESDVVRYAIGTLSIVGSVLTIFQKHKVAGTDGKGLSKHFNELIDHQATATIYLDEISVLKQLDLGKHRNRAEKIIQESNQLSKNLHLLVLRYA